MLGAAVVAIAATTETSKMVAIPAHIFADKNNPAVDDGSIRNNAKIDNYFRKKEYVQILLLVCHGPAGFVIV